MGSPTTGPPGFLPKALCQLCAFGRYGDYYITGFQKRSQTGGPVTAKQFISLRPLNLDVEVRTVSALECRQKSVRLQIQSGKSGVGISTYVISPGLCFHFPPDFSPVSPPSSVPVTTSASRSLRYVSNWAFSNDKILALGCRSAIEYYGFCSAGFGLTGATCWSSSQKRLSPGTALVFVCSGGFDPVQTKADHKQIPELRRQIKRMASENKQLSYFGRANSGTMDF
jgi:hypothetical protein